MTTQKCRETAGSCWHKPAATCRRRRAPGSEKGWGAAAQILKAVAEDRGWDHGKHRHLSRVASRLRAELGDGDIFTFYMVADSLHGNFYEDEYVAADVAEALDKVGLLIGKLDPLVGA